MNNSATLHFLKHAAPPSGSVREVGRKAADVQIGGEAHSLSLSLSFSFDELTVSREIGDQYSVPRLRVVYYENVFTDRYSSYT